MDIKADKVSSNKQTLILVFGILLLSMLIIGGTYAYLTWGIDVVNKNIVSSTTCFDIVYDITNDDNSTTPISGTLIPSSGPGGGLSGKVSMGISESCQQIQGYGIFYLDILTSTAKLLQIVEPHCENSQTLRTLTKYTDQESCEAQTNAKWVNDGNALKYAIYTTNDTSSTVPVQVGYLNTVGKNIIYENFPITNTTVDYYIYVWLDGNLVDNSYASQSFNGKISAEASQIENDNRTAYAIYSADDNSLRFYKTEDTITVGETYNGLTVTTLYNVSESYDYEIDGGPEWTYLENADDITSVIFEDTISPVSTAYWFNNLAHCSSFDLVKLDISKVTSMNYMFAGVLGKADETFNISGLLNWDVSKVTSMSSMFEYTGVNATWSLDLSGWDVSSVIEHLSFNLGVEDKVIAPTWVN